MSAELARLYYGTAQAVPQARQLSAGPWSALLADGALRDIRFHETEVIRAVAFLVRDKDWGTCRHELKGIEIDESEDGFRVSYGAHCENSDGQSLSYALSVDCTAGGALTARASVTTHGEFLTARCGFCVLHPIDGVAGAPARVEHSDGTVESAAFPASIDPWQPFKDIRAIEHDLSSHLTVRCEFAGDVFEMEDQRNWSDASFKTYSRPLEWPWPYTLEAGAALEQSVTLSVENVENAEDVEDVEDFEDKTRGDGLRVVPCKSADAAQTLSIELNALTDETMPMLGVAIAVDETDDALTQLALITELAPQQLTLSFDPTAGHGLPELERFAAFQRQSGLPAVLEYALPGVGAPRAELQTLAAQIASARLVLDGVVVSPAVHRQSNPPGSVSPPCPALDEVYREARRALPDLRIGGGMLSYFTELNRKRPPLELVDWVTHATCPIVHAADDVSVMQTLQAIPHITRSCRALIGAQPYAIGPASIGMRQNPYGSRVMPNPQGDRIAMAGSDPRQAALFGAAWLAGYAAALAGARLDTLTLGALTGARGLADIGEDARRYPMFHVAKALARMAGAARLHCDAGHAGEVMCIAARDARGNLHVLLANTTPDTQTFKLELIGSEGSADGLKAAFLDEDSVPWATTADALVYRPFSVARPVTLLPFGVVHVLADAGS
ncbi:D-apionate lactonase [Paraburkholderia strydomiana]|uniref:D-apionate lactonase n=1 Tax=Paraburkholderia strydomiana TaxID=1245417 RepID=UPI001BE96C82|nr:hypothetical protein [Paraburkholderia strydomiana]MBT2792829.1 hypothetical protein [Paraburkholderia strydomiana]